VQFDAQCLRLPTKANSCPPHTSQDAATRAAILRKPLSRPDVALWRCGYRTRGQSNRIGKNERRYISPAIVAEGVAMQTDFPLWPRHIGSSGFILGVATFVTYWPLAVGTTLTNTEIALAASDAIPNL